MRDAPIPLRLKSKIAEDIKKDGEKFRGKLLEIKTLYSVGENIYTLDLKEESEGTQRLLSMAWFIIEALQNGDVFVADELESSLHSLALRKVIELFKNPKTNPNHAQLIFTTHNTGIMDLFQRDQIWLVEKDSEYMSVLSSVNEFKGRSTDIIEKNI